VVVVVVVFLVGSFSPPRFGMLNWAWAVSERLARTGRARSRRFFMAGKGELKRGQAIAASL
jgi:hypothetical protein